MMRTSEKRFIAITDPEILYYKELSDAIPGFIQQMDNTHGMLVRVCVCVWPWVPL
jgi:hypothetical protein